MTSSPTRLADVNSMDAAAFLKLFGGVFEHSSWVAERAWARKPFASIDALHAAMADAVRLASYDEQLALIRIHPDPRHVPRRGEKAQVRVQVKSRYATDCDRGFPVEDKSFDALDFLVVASLNIGNYGQGRTGEVQRRPGEEDPTHPGDAVAGDRDARRGAPDPAALAASTRWARQSPASRS